MYFIVWSARFTLFCAFALTGSASGVHLNVMQQPWFIATIIATIGGALWFALCVFSVWLCRRRKNWRKQAHTNGVVSGIHL
jgi:Na+/melibiose symporter-like transporter